MKVLAIVAICALAVAAATPLGPNTKRIVFLGKSEPVSTRVPFRDVLKPRIINGQPASPGQFPHQVVLTIGVPGGSALCGGSLITDTWVLSAAHCVVDATSADVLLGSVTLNGDANSVSIPASQAVYHGSYDPDTVTNDVSMLQLSRAAAQNNYIRTIALNQANVGASQQLTVSGFGKTSDAGGVSQTLMYASVVSISNADCDTYYGGVPTGDICTQGSNGESTCNGDSGGPLIQGSGDSAAQVGIVSFGRSDGCQNGIPVAFTRVSTQYDWIQQVLASA